MNIYTKTGDGGTTSLQGGVRVPKHDDIVQAMGVLDELNAHLGLVRCKACCVAAEIEAIQNDIMAVMAGLSAKGGGAIGLDNRIKHLESRIDNLQSVTPKQTSFVTYGGCEKSAVIDCARAVARRAETQISKLAKKVACADEVMAYINRLSDFLYMLARNADFENVIEQAVKAAVGGNVSCESFNLNSVKPLIEEIEKQAVKMGLSAVIACCDASGNPIAVHVMPDAYLVSYNVALGKAYTAAALKMPTAEVAKLVQPGQMFYGLEALEGGKLVPIGGGVPISDKSGKLLGGLGVSGGTAEQDVKLANYGLAFLNNTGGDSVG